MVGWLDPFLEAAGWLPEIWMARVVALLLRELVILALVLSCMLYAQRFLLVQGMLKLTTREMIKKNFLIMLNAFTCVV